jgi:DNA-3-methyladenine glycosylase
MHSLQNINKYHFIYILIGVILSFVMEKHLKSIGLDLSDCVQAAPDLLGYKITYKSKGGVTSGYIVETEAYHSSDPASHSFLGLNKRNSSLFDDKGTIYVYFTYGMHYCLNIVTGNKDDGQAVLIRAIEPVDGIDLMIKRRKLKALKDLTSGPAKLTQAMSINKDLNGSNILEGPIKLEKGIKPKEIIVAPRIGITKAKEYPWRFYIGGNPFVSRFIPDA